MAATAEKRIHVQYFALLREERGASNDVVQTSAATAREFYAELQRAHGFSLGPDRLTVAVNDEFQTWDVQLQPDDCVVFIPPVAGG